MKIELGTLKEKADQLVAFLEPRVGAKPELSGGAIEIDEETAKKGLKPRKVKTYVKRFLYMNGVRKNYRVLVEGKELTVQEIELGEAEKEEKEKVAEKIEKAEGEETEEKPKEAKAEKRKAPARKKRKED